MKYLSTFKNLKVIVTGSTGFKGSWLSFWLYNLNAKVVGIGLKPEKNSIIFDSLNLSKKIKQIYIDITNLNKLDNVIRREKPDIIFHLAAQSIVSESYINPVKTIMTNVIGSANILESVKNNKIKNLVYITSDKCYYNDGRSSSYNERDLLGGEDPYSASKASAELIFKSYLKSYLNSGKKLSFATTRAGNVIGGGDMKINRIVPDIVRSIISKKSLTIRNPNATRPWQHVLEPLSGYLKLGSLLIQKKLSKSIDPHWNFGPKTSNCKTVNEVTKKIINTWNINKKITYKVNKNFKESKLLMLNSSKAKKELNWQPRLSFNETIEMTVKWYKSFIKGKNIETLSKEQIQFYLNKK